MRDRYKRLQEKFDRNDNANQRISGVGGEVSEMEELLMAMREARDDLDMEKNAKNTAELELDRRKEAVGTICRCPRQTNRGPGDKDMEQFTAPLRQMDMERVNLDRERF